MKEKLKFNLAVINFAIVFLNGFNDFISIIHNSISLDIITFKVRGFLLVFLASIILVYLLYTKNSKKAFLAYILGIIGFIITAVSFYSTLSPIYNEITIKLRIGTFLYILSFVIFIIIIFIKPDNKNKSQKYENQIGNIENIDPDLFLIANLILGIKKVPIYTTLLLKNNTKEKTLSIEYQENDKIKKINIPISNISKINIDNDITFKYQTKDNQSDIEMANTLLSYSLFGPIGSLASNNILNNITSDYQKPKFNVSFNLDITYFLNQKEKHLKINTLKNPQNFIDKLNINLK